MNRILESNVAVIQMKKNKGFLTGENEISLGWRPVDIVYHPFGYFMPQEATHSIRVYLDIIACYNFISVELYFTPHLKMQ